jgi:enterobactin synthetase component D
MTGEVVFERGWATIGLVLAATASLEALHPDERARARGMMELRRRTFVAGRAALRAAIRRRDLPELHAIGSDDRGAPVFAAARVSISHKDDLAVGLVVLDSDARHVGIDIEDLSPLKVDIASKILTHGELQILERAVRDGARRDELVRTAFSMKEAIYKAIDPVLRRYVGFREVEVLLSEDQRGPITPRLLLARDGDRIEERELSVESFLAPGVPDALLSVARLNRTRARP